LTHDDAFLEPYTLGMSQLPGDLATLEARADPDRYQTEHVLRLRGLVQQRVNYFVQVIQQTRRSGTASSSLLHRAKTTMDNIRLEVSAIADHESALLEERLDAKDAADARAKALGVAGLVLTLSGGFAAARLFGTGVTRRVKQINDWALRLVEERPIEGEVEGTDEIAEAGRALSDAATLLAERASALRNSEREMHLIVDGLAEGVVMAKTDGRFQLFNPAAEDILGLGMLEIDPDEWSRAYHIFQPDGETEFPPDDLPLARALRGESTDDVEVIARTPHRGDTWLNISGRPVRDDQNEILGGVVVFADITERKRFELELERLAAVDELTGVLNRRGFLDTAERELSLAARFHRGAVLLFVDVDGLKQVNDTLGHEVGSELLVDAAAVLMRVARSSDVVGRLGGDEFCLLAVGEPTSAKEAVEHRIRDEIRAHNASARRPYDVSVSIGSAVFDPETPDSLEDLIAQADGRMYENKRARKGA
jgi:diguanylate cyclase (GGDEF)-like protein/PAS domain S-box-containing protein